MSVFTERQAIKQRMEEIRQERRELAQEYYRLLDRLRELDSMEREAIDVETVVGSLESAIVTLRELIPHIPADALVRQVAAMVEENQIQIITEEKQEQPKVAPEHVIKEQQRKDEERIVTYKRTGRLRRDFVNQVVEDILKEHGAPMKLEDIRKKVEENLGREIGTKAFSLTMRNIMERNSKIQKVHRGFYQYRF
jgi:hypothetical protein